MTFPLFQIWRQMWMFMQLGTACPSLGHSNSHPRAQTAAMWFMSASFTLRKHPKVGQDKVFRTLVYSGKVDRFFLTKPCWSGGNTQYAIIFFYWWSLAQIIGVVWVWVPYILADAEVSVSVIGIWTTSVQDHEDQNTPDCVFEKKSKCSSSINVLWSSE